MLKTSVSGLPSEAGPARRWDPGLAQGEVFPHAESSPGITRNWMLHMLCLIQLCKFLNPLIKILPL